MINNNRIYLDGLNGIRAIAAISVVISHTILSFNLFSVKFDFWGNLINNDSEGLLLAGFGVSMFFCLSGFLITFLLMKEKSSYKKVNVPKFYMRRILKIWPLYYIYFLIAILVSYLFN